MCTEVLSLFDTAIASIDKHDKFAFDIEATGLNPFKDQLLVLSLATEDGAWAIPFAGPVPHIPWQNPEMSKRIQHVFSDPNKIAISWNGGYDIKFLKVCGFDILTKDADGMVAAYLLDEMLARSKTIGLKKQAKIRLGVDMDEFESTKLLEGIVDEHALKYAAEDAKNTYLIYVDHLLPDLINQNLMKVFERLCMPLLRVLVEMELNGCRMDVDQLKKVEEELTKSNNEVLEELKTISGDPKFNPASPKQLSTLLFGESSPLKVPIRKGHEWKIKSGQWATDKKTLRRYKKDHEIFEKLTEFRKSKKLLTTYAIPLQKWAQLSHDGRVRSHFRLTGTVTTRLASRAPNFQNIATKGGIREAFVPDDGCKIIVADYNQIELRMGGLLAHRVFGKSNIVDKYKQGSDLHEATRQTYDALGIDRFNEAAVGAEEARRNAKICNFGYYYGRSASAFAEDNPEIPYSEAEALRELFLGKLYPEINAMHDHSVKEIVENGFVTTILGARRRFAHCYGRNPEDVWWDGWVAWNSRVQGSSQGIIQLAMRDCFADIQKGRKGGEVQSKDKVLRLPPETWNKVKILIQVHDELVLEAPEEVSQDIADWLSYRMGNTLTGQVIEFPAEAGIGNNWIEAKEAPKKAKKIDSDDEFKEIEED